MTEDFIAWIMIALFVVAFLPFFVDIVAMFFVVMFEAFVGFVDAWIGFAEKIGDIVRRLR
jgi:hypothetical protein